MLLKSYIVHVTLRPERKRSIAISHVWWGASTRHDGTVRNQMTIYDRPTKTSTRRVLRTLRHLGASLAIRDQDTSTYTLLTNKYARPR